MHTTENTTEVPRLENGGPRCGEQKLPATKTGSIERALHVRAIPLREVRAGTLFNSRCCCIATPAVGHCFCSIVGCPLPCRPCSNALAILADTISLNSSF